MARTRRTKSWDGAVDILRSLAMRAFTQGFMAGADPKRAVRRHILEPANHEHWRRGFEAGRDAVIAAERVYDNSLESPPNRDRRR